MKRLKIVSKIVLILLFCIGAARFTHHQTQGFRISKITDNLMETTPSPLSAEEIQFMRKLFGQKFHFLGRGLQSFVFESEDGEYVIKIFNNSYKRRIGLYSFLEPFTADKISHLREKWKKTFASYALAFDEMREKTALEFIHLHPTEGLPPLTLIDRLNIRHRLNPNKLGFLIQKKVKMAYPALREMIQVQDIAGAKCAISSLLDLFLWKFAHQIQDNDPLIRTNFGFIGYEAFQIDVGPLSKATTAQDPKEIIRITTSLKNWLSENCPELVIYLDQQLQERLSY